MKEKIPVTLLGMLLLALLSSPSQAASYSDETVGYSGAPTNRFHSARTSSLLNSSQEPLYREPIRAYVGVVAGFPSVGGDLDGTKVLVNQEQSETIFLPQFNTGAGGGLKFGARRVSNEPLDFGGELSFLWSSHQGHEGIFSKNATMLTLNADFKMYLNQWLPMEPYISAGICLPYLFIKNGDVKSSGSSGMATLSGYGFNLGAGLDHALTDRLRLDAGIVYRIAAFTVAAVSDNKNMRIKPAQSLQSLVPQISLNYFIN